MSETDRQLLTRYVRQRADDAFTEIVRRHVDLIHSAAQRQVRSPQLAEEVAQAVFMELARRADQLPSDTIVGAWLYQQTRRRAIDVVRREAGRRLREEAAQELHAMNATAEDWTHIEPLLDEAMHALEDNDRMAVLLRYFQNKSLREVGEALGVTDDAAQKRVSRAVERLREFFAKRGVTVGASGIVVALSTKAVQAAPAGLVFTISSATAALLSATALPIVPTVTKAIAMTTLQKALVATAFAATIGAGIYEAIQASQARVELQLQRGSEAEQNQQARQEWEEASAKLSALAEENARLKSAVAEVIRLRAEVTRLRGSEQELVRLRAVAPPPTLVNEGSETELTKASWADVGFATPQAVLRTRGWSVLNTNLERFAESVFVTDRARMAFNDQIGQMLAAAGNSEQARAAAHELSDKKFPLEEGLMLRLRGENIGGAYTGYRIISQQSPSAEEMVMEVETLMESRPSRKEIITFRKFDRDWRIVVDLKPKPTGE